MFNISAASAITGMRAIVALANKPADGGVLARPSQARRSLYLLGFP
jgi:hypothetical protein